MKNLGTKVGQVTRTVLQHRWRFLGLFLLVFFLTLLFFSFIGFVPESLEAGHASDDSHYSSGTVEEDDPATPASPRRIIIDAIGVDVSVENPESADIAVLDDALMRGAVRYPGSGFLDEEANVFLFGHSSYLPAVVNRNYQAFNGLQKLSAGDTIRVQSATDEYVYRVSSVRKSAAGDIVVDLRRGTRKLTLSTCDSFGAKDERFVVEAAFVGSYPLSS